MDQKMRLTDAKWLILTLPLLLLIPNLVLAIDTDIVIFDNGDRLTGEVKSLSRGKLNFKTTATGTISIEWDHVAFVRSDQNLQVETGDGSRYLGKLRKTEDKQVLVVLSGQDTTELHMGNVVELSKIDQQGWQDWDIDVSGGYNFASADSAAQFNFGLDASHRTVKRIIGATFSTIISTSSSSEKSENDSLGLNWTALRRNRWFTAGNLDFTKNTELGLDLRTSLGFGVGRFLVESNRSEFSLEGGLKVSREENRDVADNTDSLEAYGTLSWDWFHYDSPEWDISTDLEVIPSLSQWNRVRYDFNTTVKWEIIDDLYWSIQLYDNFDSQPPSAGAENHNYGVITSFSYDLR